MTSFYRTLLPVGALLLGGVQFLFAEHVAEAAIADTVFLNEVVVSATKTEVNRGEIPLTISVVSRETLDASTETGVLSVLSEQVPGLFVTEKGVTGYGISDGSAGAVSIHGVGGVGRVLMLFDGQPMWAGIFGHNIADAYVASDAQKVEVIRGPGSLLYGSNAMGGVINVITRRANEDGFHGKARAMYGSYNTWKLAANAGYKKDKLNAFASLNRDQTDGQRTNSSFYINNGFVKLGYELSDNWNVSANALLADFKTNDPGQVSAPLFEHWAKALRTTYSAAITNTYDKMSGSLQVFYNHGKHKINDGYAEGGMPRTVLFESTDFNGGFALYESFRLIEGNEFTVGVDAKQWGGKAWGTTEVDKRVNEQAGYVVTQQKLGDQFTVNAGVRLEHNENYGNEWVPQAGITYQLNDLSSFKASFSKGFRSPNLRELYMFPPHNPDLKPEKMVNYDFSYLQSFGDKFHFELTAYYINGENLIDVAFVEGGPKNINTGKFTNKGIDFAATYVISPALRAMVNYSYLDSDVKLTTAPKHKLFANVDYTFGKWKITPNVQVVNDLYLGEGDHYDSYALVNCKMAYNPTSTIRLFLDGENLTDTSYQTYQGYPLPGFVILGGVDVRF
ncbi:MAG: TonB-dependent receptor [Candidatus Symbiothrix sp.]|jgi:iron complex outermembrane receptor protein|nr:TonB-dependent receptor [Candidatus Symbiothrix sp.]